MHKIAYKITAVREREDYVEKLLFKMPGTEVFWDEEKIGCIWNTQRAWKSYRNLPPDVTHLCVMSDDTDIVNGFEDLVQICVDNFPDVIWTFYSNQLSMKNRPRTTPYIVLDAYNVRGIAFLMPVNWVQGYIDTYERLLKPYNYKRDDVAARIYALLNRRTVMTTIPNLVRSEEIASTIRGHKPSRNSDCWQGYNVDERQFRQRYAEHRFITSKSVVETFLPKGHPIDVMVRNEFNKQRKMQKAMRGN